MQHGIDRSFRKIECASALALDLLDHGVAVRRARRKRGEHDHVEMSLEPFAFHVRILWRIGYSPRNCFCSPWKSTMSQCSANFPFSMRQISMVLKVKRRPVGAMPCIGWVCVAVNVIRATTLSPAMILSSTFA